MAIPPRTYIQGVRGLGLKGFRVLYSFIRVVHLAIRVWGVRAFGFHTRLHLAIREGGAMMSHPFFIS